MEQTPIDIVRSFADVPTLECVIYCVVFGSVWPNLTMDNSWNEKKKGDTMNTSARFFSYT